MTDDFPPTRPEAYTELREALAFHEALSVQSARALARRIDAVVRQLQLFPESGGPYLFGTRRLLLTPLPYEMVYVIDGGIVRIIAFSHTSREAGYWKDRLN